MIHKALPQPMLSAVLLATWLLVQGSVSPGAVLLGVILAWAIPLFSNRFWPEATTGYKPIKIIKYTAVGLFDIVVANIEVAWLILTKRTEDLEPHFIEIPLDLDHSFAITILAHTISLTPGTVSSNVSGDKSTLLVHCLDCPDQQAEIDRIKRRYEARLEEIFNG